MYSDLPKSHALATACIMAAFGWLAFAL